MTCKECELHITRHNIVLGQGNPDSKLFFIGEAPGYHEDQKGIPFIGRAGKVLDSLLESINFNRHDIYITNVVKCRPPNNRNPTEDEIFTCSKFLDIELSTINPKIIIPMGTFATKYIFDKYHLTFTSISEVRGKKLQSYEKIIFPIYHPAATIYNQALRDVMKKDFKLIKEISDGS